MNIPDELAKRVLEALDEACDDAAQFLNDTMTMYGEGHWRTDRADRAFDAVFTTRDELAALLTPKEAT